MTGPLRALGRGLAAAAPVAALGVATGAAAGLTRWLAPLHTVYLSGPLWATVLLVGVAAAVAAAVTQLARRWHARGRAASAAAARQAAAEEHRRFLLRLDHELKNPVTALRAGVANLAVQLEEAAPASNAVAGAVESITAQTRRLATMVADLRKLAELETRPIEHSRVDMAELLTEVCEAAEPADRTLTLTLPQAPWPLSSVDGDRDLLSLALLNLLGNAVKFTRPGDRIELRAHDDGQQVVVEVADTGIGIPADEVGQVWDELTRGRAARGTPGMGLGLALVRAVVTRHRGTVSLRSREGSGTVVAVRLPAAPPAIGRASVAAATGRLNAS